MRTLVIAALLLTTTGAFADDASTARIAALEARIAALEARISDLEKAPAPAASGLPTDEEFERTLGFMERFMRRFIGVAKELEGEKTPDRT